MNNYEKSQNACIKDALRQGKMLSGKIEAQEMLKKEQITQDDLQYLANKILGNFVVKEIPIVFVDVQRQGKKGFLALSKGLKNIPAYILIYKYTEKRKQLVTPKDAIKTLVHELTHALDYTVFGLERSVHTTGFYNRVEFITNYLLH